ncbi:unnamed protein product [Porites lobata]|uniref:Uncharacterized protein n=1 Tax=Porites lobata TaxID=104759 RepID=A0ABN8P1V7_9CNID|nr:unnamed protein product [Porites lobata]
MKGQSPSYYEPLNPSLVEENIFMGVRRVAGSYILFLHEQFSEPHSTGGRDIETGKTGAAS